MLIDPDAWRYKGVIRAADLYIELSDYLKSGARGLADAAFNGDEEVTAALLLRGDLERTGMLD